MGRDAALYWKNRETGRIGFADIGRASHYEHLSEINARWYNYMGLAQENWFPELEWVPYDTLKTNLEVISRLREGKITADVRHVIAQARKRKTKCDFCIVVEDHEDAAPQEVQDWRERQWARKEIRHSIAARRQARENARGYRTVKEALREKIARQWED